MPLQTLRSSTTKSQSTRFSKVLIRIEHIPTPYQSIMTVPNEVASLQRTPKLPEVLLCLRRSVSASLSSSECLLSASVFWVWGSIPNETLDSVCVCLWCTVEAGKLVHHELS